MIPKLAIFDLDGTLIDPQLDYFASESARILGLLGVELEIERIRESYQHHAFGSLFPEERGEKLIKDFWQVMWSTPTPVEIVPGVLDTLELFARRGTHLAIATARPHGEEELRNELAASGLLDWIDIVSTWRGESWKDKTEQILRICKRVGVDPGESLMAGDLPVDVISAKAAECHWSVGVLTGGLRREILEKLEPRILTNAVSDIPDHLAMR
jgi:phosphoglycolate phosphatase-like HAD superfamily hydrolase